MAGVTNILLVEDEGLIREWLSEALEEAGYAVVAVSNADEAIAVLEARNDIYLVLTDIDMPGSMDGLKLAAAVRDRGVQIIERRIAGREDETQGQGQ